MKQYNIYVLPVLFVLAALYLFFNDTSKPVEPEIIVTVRKSVWAHYAKNEIREEDKELYKVHWSELASKEVDTSFVLPLGKTISDLVDLKTFPKADYSLSDIQGFLHFKPDVAIWATLYLEKEQYNFTTLHAVDSISKHYGDLQK